MSPAERRRWNMLKSDPGEHRFSKQHPCEQFTLDFFCPARGLVIEVDGESRNRGNRPALDMARDARCAELGFATLLIPALELVKELDAVVAYIVHAADQRPLRFER